MIDPYFSIIIPTYNRAPLIEKTINSVLQQTYSNYELIIIDDGSTDNTKEVVENIIKSNLSKKIIYKYQKNSERAASRNNGLKNSCGDYIIYFDSDDTLYQNHLEVANKYILKHKFPEFIHLRYDIKNSNGEKYAEGPIYKSSPNKQLILGNFLSCNGVILKREIALQNQFNEDRVLSAAEDWELWIRLAVKYPIHYINTITSSIYNHDARSVVVTDKKKLIERFNVFLNIIISNKVVVDYYKDKIHLLKCSCYTYISLHLALTKKYRKDTLVYLFKGIRQNIYFIFTRRFFAILKHII